MRHRIHLPSPAMVVACLALVVALGGTGYAAVKIPPDSVGRSAIREGAVGTAQVRDGSLQAKDFKEGVLPVLPKPATSTVRQASGDAVPAGAVGAVSAACLAGERATGGGGGFAGPPTTNDNVVDSLPVGGEAVPSKWRISLFNGGTAPRTPVAYVLCAKG
jgi:hypothetical protein